MVNWHDPLVERFCTRIAFILSDICAGCYIWEFCISIRFDWDHLVRKRPLRLNLIAYMGARYLALLTFIGILRVSYVPGPITTCSTWWHFNVTTGHLAVVMSSILLGIRAIAIARCSKSIIAVLVVLGLASLGTSTLADVTIRGVYIAELHVCAATNVEHERVNDIITASLDTLCLAILVCALWAVRGEGGLWRFLAAQGMLGFVAATVAYVPSVIVLMLNLNDGMNQLLGPMTLTSLVVCSTRMYRNLLDFDDVENDILSQTTPNLQWGHYTQGSGDVPLTYIITRSSNVDNATSSDPRTDRVDERKVDISIGNSVQEPYGLPSQ
ncbi:hypothetical protein EXIGLDRAFT_845105 [Exidia glandulosa HHB12029]|uniref:Uncharacterized protein n=1 Tax=Exidia glandulosa HHB12029 TaxID=1314781 RepID=A0A165BMU5_EXIGL|nr:hypothetical protein EXIGLDRAFT_845105 [Exidia glandulosa HHB12029]